MAEHAGKLAGVTRAGAIGGRSEDAEGGLCPDACHLGRRQAVGLCNVAIGFHANLRSTGD
ncbi:hypothetical protein GCM10009789_27040 [Kribbella sancticallisti]|uniref:Uncharacterized protein n=1 Tax=Kribbella sancticallisti TaxID=460087 RepID=A0ABP4P5L6_9ACTN